MRRFVTLVILLLFAIPFGVSISGCSKNLRPIFCNGGDSGVTDRSGHDHHAEPHRLRNLAELCADRAGQYAFRDRLQGLRRLGFGLHLRHHRYDHRRCQPTNGRLCAGTWNRNSGGGIPDFTFCNPTGKSGTAYVSASADGVTSNPLPVFVHPVVTSIVLGAPRQTAPPIRTRTAALRRSAQRSESANAACPTSTAVPSNPQLPNGCCSIPPNTVFASQLPPAPPYRRHPACPKADRATGRPRLRRHRLDQTNISCLSGHLQFTAQGAASTTNISPIVCIDQNGIATANQPGSVPLSANIANAASSAGFFSTCPPVSMALAPGADHKSSRRQPEQYSAYGGHRGGRQRCYPDRPRASV